VGRPSHRGEGNIKNIKKHSVNHPPVQNLLSAVSNGEICEHAHLETSREKKSHQGRPSHKWDDGIKISFRKKNSVNCPLVQNLSSAVSNGEICKNNPAP
jgi:hypothetical protein